MSVKVVKDNTEEVEAALKAAMARALEKVGLLCEGYAKVKCPVDTGRLRNSITHTTDEKFAYIGTNVEYGPHVELGTSRTKAQPFLRPAATDHMDQYRNVFRTELGGK